MQKIFIRDVNKNDYIKRKENSKKVYIAKGWCRSNKAYVIQDASDMSHYLYVKSFTPVYVGFTY